MSTRPGAGARWPEHLPVGACGLGRSSARYDEAMRFYRNLIGLPVLESFADSYGGDGVIFGLPDTSVQLEILRWTEPVVRVDRLDSLVFYAVLPNLQDEAQYSNRYWCVASTTSQPIRLRHSSSAKA
jgi:hypothetical protein